ncbi:hypothetical protein NP233_g1834 [Leucocoprinus birnbaumii]|uniref:Uncharacterized protein n=1 Tax=Leucocoprinus birnbaumii TaxID=56174 RepID=A0AAD5VZB4_9AGAR|nr:hypothetical protein NP233_g1834 [Leucocoprinus birnbaumii]
MVRVFGLALAFLYASSSVSAAPLETRQLGGVACNVARLKTVAGLRQTTTAVNKLASSSDPAAADAATTAQSALQDASDGIKTIAKSLLTGQQAPAAARNQVAQGLEAAQAALSNVTSTDSTTTSQVSDALTKLQNTISAGEDVVSQCGGGGADATATDTSATTDTSTASTATGTDASSTDTSDSTTTDSSTATGATGSSADSTDSTTTTDTGSSADSTDSTTGTDTGSSTDSTDSATGTNTGTGADTSAATDNTSAADNTATGGPLSALAGLRNSRLFGKRQIGGIACNVARFQTVGRLAQSSAAVNAVKSAASADPAAASAATTAGTALNSAKGGIAKIAVALLAGQKAPAAARDQVEQGLNDAMSALTSVSSTDPNVTSAISGATDKISSTIQAGQQVFIMCLDNRDMQALRAAHIPRLRIRLANPSFRWYLLSPPRSYSSLKNLSTWRTRCWYRADGTARPKWKGILWLSSISLIALQSYGVSTAAKEFVHVVWLVQAQRVYATLSSYDLSNPWDLACYALEFLACVLTEEDKQKKIYGAKGLRKKLEQAITNTPGLHALLLDELKNLHDILDSAISPEEKVQRIADLVANTNSGLNRLKQDAAGFSLEEDEGEQSHRGDTYEVTG